jgi:hypothetical protein
MGTTKFSFGAWRSSLTRRRDAQRRGTHRGIVDALRETQREAMLPPAYDDEPQGEGSAQGG